MNKENDMAGRPKKSVEVSNQIDWQGMCEKLQDALSKEMIETQRLEQERGQLINDIARQAVIIQYLESKFR
jgi:hypothetical protein